MLKFMALVLSLISVIDLCIYRHDQRLCPGGTFWRFAPSWQGQRWAGQRDIYWPGQPGTATHRSSPVPGAPSPWMLILCKQVQDDQS